MADSSETVDYRQVLLAGYCLGIGTVLVFVAAGVLG